MRRKNSDIDKAFTDRAWSAMKVMLDREMPVPEQKKRPVFWWWFSGALIIGLILGGAGVWLVGSGGKHQPASPSENPVEQPLPASAPVAAGVSQPENSTSPAFTEGKIADRKKEDEKSGTDRYSLLESDRTTMPEHPSAALPEAKGQKAAPAEKVFAEEEPLPHRGLLSAIALEKPHTPKLLRVSGPALSVGSSGRFSASKIKSFYLAAQQNAPSVGFGFAVGMQRHFPLGHSRLSLGIGVGYAYLQRPLFIHQTDTLTVTSTLETADEDYGFEQINTALFEASGAISTNRRVDLAMHYLELPLTLSRPFGRRFGLTAGVTPSILLATAPDLASGGLFRSTAKAGITPNMQSGNPPPFGDAATQVPVSGFDLTLKGGAYYRLSPVWKLALSYEHGLVDVLEGNSTKEYHRLLRLGVHYSVSTR